MFDDCRLGQRLRRGPLLIPLRNKVGRTDQYPRRIGKLETSSAACYVPLRPREQLFGNPNIIHFFIYNYNVNIFNRLIHQAATKGAEKMIGDSLRSNPQNSVGPIVEVKERLKSGRYAYSIVSI